MHSRVTIDARSDAPWEMSPDTEEETVGNPT
jgi:hypothetical protein